MYSALLCLLLLGGATSQKNDGLFELNIIHYNDFHAHFDEVSPTGSACNPSVDPCIGGFARLYTAVQQVLEAEPDSLLFNGGDTFQGTIWYNFLTWNVTQHFMNLLPHDAHVLGNHEFDHGVEGLVPYLKHLKSPMLGANVNTTFEPTMTPYIKNHIVVTRRNRKIGIIGVLLRSFSAPIGNVIIEDEVEAINREAAILTAAGVDIIIVLSHVGYTSDLFMARRISSDVDIIVGAHSHTLLYTGETPSGQNPVGNYPTVVTQDNGHRIPVVQAYCYTRYLGNIKLFIDDDGIVQRWEGQPIYLGSTIVQDPEILKELEPWREEVDAVGKEVLGSTLATLDQRCTQGECTLGTWACDGFLEELMDRAKGSAWHDAHVCLINSGGLRVQIDPGNVTTEALLMAMPFENHVQVYDLKGKYLLEALEFSVGVEVSGNFNSRRMLQIGGMRNVYNVSKPIGSRVSATVRCIECDVPRYEPLDPDATYRVVTQNYIGDGGGGYTMLSNNRENVETLPYADYVMLQHYMRRQKTVVRDLDGRIQIVYFKMHSVVLCLLLLGGVISQKNDGLFELNIIHYNDFHAHFDEVSPTGSACNPSVDPCIGGFARLYTAVQQVLEAEPDSLLFNGGDSFQGTIWYKFLTWNVTQHFMNMLPHDAHVLGNHEFNHGVGGLVPYLERLHSPMLGANVNTTFEPTMTPYIKNHIVVTRRNRKIGIIGVLLRSFSASIGKLIMEDEVEAINREAAILTAAGVDIIIVLSHVGYTSDLVMARRISSDVDIIVGAHSHTLLYTGETPNGQNPSGDYPTVVTQDNGHRIPVVQAYCYTRYLGNIKLFIDDDGIVQRWEGQPIYLGSSIVQDPQILKKLEPWKEEVDSVGKEVLGSSLATLDQRCFQGECALGILVADAILEEIMVRAEGAKWHDAHVCLINSGGLRMQIDPGYMTTEALLMAMPFENHVQVYDLKGKYLLEALEFSVGVTITPGNFFSRRLLQIGGMRNVYNMSKPIGSRVSATVRCIECDVPRYEPLDPDATYRVVTQNYIGNGGDGYTMLSNNKENVETLPYTDFVMLQQYMRRQKTILQDLDGRIQIVY
ncbi:trifunctional nucleotide phosphoesterase protein YfkN-like [Galleria mellonella]|uniref:apyrase n=1 Tax=Galleria mellonella TaxID=7137 RepID=A0ABM3MKD4_GALME|nr:trifunctional nucleotide phosphoesterase protein YfkN-like [Galleria mellonella]